MKRPVRKRDTALLPFAIFDAHNNTSLSLAREQEEAVQRAGKEQRGRRRGQWGGVWRASGVRPCVLSEMNRKLVLFEG